MEALQNKNKPEGDAQSFSIAFRMESCQGAATEEGAAAAAAAKELGKTLAAC